MKKVLYILLGCTLVLASCRDRETEGLTEGEIAFPSIIVLGDSPFVAIAGSGFADPGAQAFLGTEDITPQMEVTSNVDANTAGVYSVGYTVSTTNVLGSESTVNQSRAVIITAGDVSGVDLSGNYLRNNDATNPVVAVTKASNAVYNFTNIFGSGTTVAGFQFFHLGGTTLDSGIQNSQFGRLRGTGTITAAGFDMQYEFFDAPNTGLILNRSFTKQ